MQFFLYGITYSEMGIFFMAQHDKLIKLENIIYSRISFGYIDFARFDRAILSLRVQYNFRYALL
jgi:hypothetical protein